MIVSKVSNTCDYKSGLTGDFLRRDQIFLVRKNNQYATEITTLFDEGVRSDSVYQKKYFSEGFRAVPKLKKPNLSSGDQLNLFQENNNIEYHIYV